MAMAVLVLAVWVSSSYASQLCAPRSGTVRVRETCRERETVLGGVASQGIGLPGLVVVDANDKLVGPVTNATSGFVTVARRIGDAMVLLDVTVEGFVGYPGPPNLRYESTDCSGTPFFTGSRLMFAHAEVYGTVAHFATLPTTIRTQRSALGGPFTEAECSARSGTFSPPNLCCITEESPLQQSLAGDLTTFDLATFGLVPPFRVSGP
jgi:hypothetical protein